MHISFVHNIGTELKIEHIHGFFSTRKLAGSELNRSAERPLKCAKMTVMDILEYRYINGPDPYNEIWFK